MDLSSVPHIMPTLGLLAGRDRRDASNRGLAKRRPPTRRQNLQDKVKSPEVRKIIIVDIGIFSVMSQGFEHELCMHPRAYGL